MSDSNKSTSAVGQAIETGGDAVSEKLNAPDILRHLEGFATDRLPGLHELLPDAIRKLEDHATLENYEKLVQEIRDLGSDASKLKGKVVDAMWKKLQDKNQGFIGKLMGMFDGVGKWILGKLFDMGILGNDLAKKFKDQAADFLSDAKGKLAGVATVAGAGAALGKLKDGLGGAMEKGKELVSEIPDFNAVRDQAKETLQEYKQLAEDMHVTGAVEAIGQVSERVGKLTYETISDRGRKALEGFLKNPKPELAPQVLSILVAEIKELEHLQVVEEIHAFGIRDPKEKAKFISRNAYLRLKEWLKAKGVNEHAIREKGIDRLMAEIQEADYSRVPEEKWKNLQTAVEGLGQGIRLLNDGGIYYFVDRTIGFGSFIAGFSPSKPSDEIAKRIPPVYFGQIGILQLREKIDEGADAFFGPLKAVLSDRTSTTLAALEEIEADVKTGKVSYADLILHPTTSKMGKFYAALREDCSLGNVVLGVGQSALAVGAVGGWYVFKTVLWDGFAGSLSASAGELWKNGDLKASARAGTSEYFQAVSPFMAFFAGKNVIRNFKADNLVDPTQINEVVMGAISGAVLLPGRVAYLSGKALVSSWKGLGRSINSGSNFGKLTATRGRYYTNLNYFDRSLLLKLPRKLMRGDFINAPNITRMEDIGTGLRELGYLEEMQGLMRKGKVGFGIREIMLPDYEKDITHVRNAIDHDIQEYVRRNFSRLLKESEITAIRDGLLHEMEVGKGRVWLTTDYVQRLQARMDLLIMQKGHVTKILGETLADADELRELEELEKKASDPARTARIAVLRAARFAPKSVSDTIESLSHDFEEEMKKAKPDNVKLRKILADLVAQEDKVVSQIGGNLNSMRSELAADAGLGRQAMLEAAHANEQVGDLVAKRSARVKALLALDSGFAAEAKTVMEATDGLCESYRSRITLLAKSITEDYKKLKGAAKSAGTEREFVDAYKRLMTGHSGGNVMTRLFRSAGGRLKFGVLLAGAMAGVMGTFEAMKDDKDASKRDFFTFLYEQGPQMLDIIVSVLPIVGFSADFSAAWKGKNVITGQDLTTGERWGKVAWGVTGLAGDALTVIGLATSWTGIGAGVAGGGVASKIAAAALRFGLKAPQAARLGTRLAEFLMRFGPKQVMLMLEEYRSATTLAAKAAMATRATHKVGMVVSVTQEAGRLIYGLLDDDPGFQAPAEALADLKDAEGIAPFPSEAKIEHQKKAA